VPGPPPPSIQLATSPSVAREARSFLREALRDSPPDQVALASRLTSEIVDMIVRHVIAPLGKTIRVTAGGGDDGGLRVTIRERGPGLALGMASDDPADVSVRRLLEATSSRWAIAESITGTYLWFELEESTT
jgi:anti-sigma regulatory factor (Ser/Thr protein kinase)